jgi:hypothetical protein
MAAASEASSSSTPVRVLYIGGMGRSGSTLLEVLLRQVDGVWPVGELRYLWERGPLDDVVCACGNHFSRCDFWQNVGRSAFGGWRRSDAQRMLVLASQVDRHRYLPLILRPELSKSFRRRLEEYTTTLGPLYDAIRATSGCDLIVDGSKDPPYAFILQRISTVDLKLLHLVRDSRGVAYSWTKRVVRPEVTDRVAYMGQVPPARMALRWNDYNLLFHALGNRRIGGASRMFARYETLVANPRGLLETILTYAGVEVQPTTLDFIRDVVPLRGESHSLSGNPLRFQKKDIAIRIDDEWKTAMNAWDERVVRLLTWPLLRQYGYLSASAAGQASDHPERFDEPAGTVREP